MAGLSLFLLVGGYFYLRHAWETQFALRWLVLSGAAAAYLLWILWRNLPLNQAMTGDVLFPQLGLPNLVTYWRGFLVAAAAGFMFSPRPSGDALWIPGALYSFGVLPDFLDGYLARATRRSTRLGENLDVTVDGLAVLSGTLLAVQYGQAPAWYLSVGLARYLYLFGIWMRRRTGRPIYDLPPNMLRRALAGTQMGFTMVLLWPLFGPPATHFATYLFAIPFLANFILDWFYASGVLRQPAIPQRPSVPSAVRRWLPVMLRLFLTASLGRVLFDWIAEIAYQVERFGALGVAQAGLLVALICGLQAAVVLGLGLGVMGRTSAVLAICLVAFHLRFGAAFNLEAVLALLACTGLLYLGSGAYALWSPEEELLSRRAGEGV